MRSESDIDAFIQNAQGKVLMAGYGSLLSRYSRKTYSNIESHSIGVVVKGWERNWITRSTTEMQTYAGAIANAQSALSAQLIALQFDQSFEKREKDYRFTQLNASEIDIISSYAEASQKLATFLFETPIYICETLSVAPSNEEFPVNLSYLETCLTGSYELDGQAGVDAFLKHTNGWNGAHFNDDRTEHLYPRSTPVTNPRWDVLDLVNRAKIKPTL